MNIMTKYKVGDIVVSKGLFWDEGLTMDKEYTILEAGRLSHIKIMDDNGKEVWKYLHKFHWVRSPVVKLPTVTLPEDLFTL